MQVSKYMKFLAMTVATVLVAVNFALNGDGVVSSTEWVNIAIMGVGSLGVFSAANVPGAKYTKAVLAVLSAGLMVLSTAIVGGINTTEMISIVIAGLGAVGVYAVKNSDAGF